MTVTLKPQGSLADRDFPHLVQDLQEHSWTGVVILTHAGVGKRLKVQKGRMVFASSTSPDERLGELLLRRGRISLPQYEAAGRAVAPGKRFGTILVEQGILEPKDLIKAVVEHTQEIIYGAFLWTEGQYRLQDGETDGEDITLRINTPDLILEGIRRIGTWSRIARGCGGLTARYARGPGWEKLVGQMTLSSEQRGLIDQCDGVRDIESLCSGSSLSDFQVCQTLWAFRVIGMLRWEGQPEPAQPEIQDEGLGFIISDGS
jgi:hypothetical protein